MLRLLFEETDVSNSAMVQTSSDELVLDVRSQREMRSATVSSLLLEIWQGDFHLQIAVPYVQCVIFFSSIYACDGLKRISR